MKYSPDHVGTAAYLKSSPELAAELHRRAILGLEVARALAPHRTGALARSGHVEQGDMGMTTSHDRMVVSVAFDIPYAAAATWEPGPDESEYLRAAIQAMEAG